MKKIFIFLVLFFIQYAQETKGQIANWSPLTRLTTGSYKDINPDFGSQQAVTFSIFNSVEFLVFQRTTDTISSICVIKFNREGPADSLRHLTFNNYKNQNPCVAYTFFGGDSVRNALALWETNQNGNWDIYGSYFSSNTGWSLPFAVDSGAGNATNPKAIMYTSSEFGITYSKDNDIIFRRYNAVTKTVITEANITASITPSCSKPYIEILGANTFAAFHCIKPDNSFCIYKTISSNSGVSWVNTDTISYSGNNKIDQLTINSSNNGNYLYESNKQGKYAIYEGSLQSPFLSSQNYNYYNFKTYFYPIITNNPVLTSNISAVVRKSADSTKIMFDPSSFQGGRKDSISLGDTTKKVVLTMNQGMRNQQGVAIFMVFNIDTAGFTSLYYRSRTVPIDNIQFISGTAENFNLYQNYPNPFNPATKIKFDIPKISDVKITIFDAAGREVKNMIQNNLPAGSYKYEFSGENLSSGIYFFKLQTGEFSKTVKMVLMK